MRSFTMPLLLAAVLSTNGCAATANYAHPRPVGFWESEEAVVQVLNYSGNLGTGAVVDTKGLVLTNYHVIADAAGSTNLEAFAMRYYLVCKAPNGDQKCELAMVTAIDKDQDLALLRVDKVFTRAIEFADEDTLLPGDEIYMWSNILKFVPLAPLFGRFTKMVGPPYFNDEQVDIALPLLLLDINASPGSSGSPVFNMSGKCVGWLARSTLTPPGGGRSLGAAVPSSTVLKFLKNSKLYGVKK